jgi:hypothetical protein
MSVNGVWDVVVKAPMGELPQKVTLLTEGGVLTGKHENQFGTVEIKGGRADGDKLAWYVETPQPMQMKLELEAQISGDQISGIVKTPFGPASLSGVRVR